MMRALVYSGQEGIKKASHGRSYGLIHTLIYTSARSDLDITKCSPAWVALRMLWRRCRSILPNCMASVRAVRSTTAFRMIHV